MARLLLLSWVGWACVGSAPSADSDESGTPPAQADSSADTEAPPDSDADSDTRVDTASGEGTVDTVGLPAGAIVMWSGSLDAVPEGWVLCDGDNGTPDLSGRFLVGAGKEYEAGTAGDGQAELTIETTSVLRCNGCTSEENPVESVVLEEAVPPWYAIAFIMRTD